MVKFLVISKANEGVEMKDLAPHAVEETYAAWELHKKGVVRIANMRKDRPGVVLILECKDEEEARKELSTLPMIGKGLVGYDLIELTPYMGWEKLFKDQKE